MDEEEWYVCLIHPIYILTYNGNITQPLKRNKILSTTWMDLENIILSKVRQTEYQILYVFTYMWNLKKMNISKRKQTHI